MTRLNEAETKQEKTGSSRHRDRRAMTKCGSGLTMMHFRRLAS